MKMKFKNIFYLFFIIGSLQAQVDGEAEYLIKYEVDFVLDTTNREDVKHEVHRLYTGSTTSKYISDGLFYRDSIMQVMRNQPRGNWRAMRGTMENMPRSEFNPVVYKDLNTSGVWVENTRSEEHTSELQSRGQIVCRPLLAKKKKTQ